MQFSDFHLRSAIVALTTIGSTGVIGAAFWWQDLRYALPTPVPTGWKATPLGTRLAPKARPRLRLFVSGTCPCSRFALDAFDRQAAELGHRATFELVNVGARPLVSSQAPSVPDPQGALARRAGVYSTPQVVVLDGEGRLAFRGNPNLTRFCDARKTEFGRLALEAVLAERPQPRFPAAATIAYGCAIGGRP